MRDRDAETEIRNLFAVYGAGFDDADPDAVTELFAWPAKIWQFGEGHIFEDADELAENIEALMDVFHDADIVVTIPDVRDVRVAGTAAFASVNWRQEDEAGKPMHEYACQYMLVASNGAWRIASVVNEPDPSDAEPSQADFSVAISK